MGELLKRVLMWAIGSAIARIVTGFGITVITYASLNGLLHDYLNEMVAAVQGVPNSALNVLLMAGVGEAIGIIGSAALARMAIMTAANVFGVNPQ